LPDGTKVKFHRSGSARGVRQLAGESGKRMVRPQCRQPHLVMADGRGIIHEADDIRPDNPPDNPHCWLIWNTSWSRAATT